MTQDNTLVSPTPSACLKPGAKNSPRLSPADSGDTTLIELSAFPAERSPVTTPRESERPRICVFDLSLEKTTGSSPGLLGPADPYIPFLPFSENSHNHHTLRHNNSRYPH